MKKILLVSYMFSPERNPRAFRWTTLALEFKQLGYSVHVITNTQENIEGLKIDGRVYRNASSPDSKNVLKPKSKLREIFRSFVKFFIWPDLTVRWVPWALIKTYKVSKSTDFDLIISSSHPMTSHLPVWFLVKLGILKPKKWIADFGDPFGLVNDHELNNLKLYKRLNFLYEKSVCSIADEVTVTTEETHELYKNGYNLGNKIKVIPPVLSLSRKEGVNPFKEKFNFVFAGTLYSKIRSPRLVLEFAKYLQQSDHKDYAIHFFGAVGDCEALFSEKLSNVHLHGLINQVELYNFLKHASAIINIGNSTKYQLPSKIVEAIAMEKFIFNFISDGHDTSLKYLKNHPAHANITSQDDFSLSVNVFENFLKHGSDLSSYSKTILLRHSAGEVAKQYLEIIK